MRAAPCPSARWSRARAGRAEPVEQQPENADHDHAEHDDFGAIEIARDKQHVAETEIGRDHFGCDQPAPRKAEPGADAGHDIRQGARQQHVGEHRGAPGAERGGGIAHRKRNGRDAEQRVVGDDEEHRIEDDKGDGPEAVAEPERGDGDPGDAGEHGEKAEQRREEHRDPAAHPHQDAERDGDEQRQHRADQDAQQARADMRGQRAVPDPFDPCLDHRIQCGKQTRVDVEIRNEDGPEHEQHGERQQKHQRRGEPSWKRHRRKPKPAAQPAGAHTNYQSATRGQSCSRHFRAQFDTGAESGLWRIRGLAMSGSTECRDWSRNTCASLRICGHSGQLSAIVGAEQPRRPVRSIRTYLV